jgi:hypothetical protein
MISNHIEKDDLQPYRQGRSLPSGQGAGVVYSRLVRPESYPGICLSNGIGCYMYIVYIEFIYIHDYIQVYIYIVIYDYI